MQKFYLFLYEVIALLNSFFIILLLAFPSLSPAIQLNESITTKSESIEYTVKNAIGLNFEMHYFRLEIEENKKWEEVTPLQEGHLDIGYPFEISFKEKVYHIDLIKTFGHLLRQGNYRLIVQFNYDNTALQAACDFSVTSPLSLSA